MTPFTDAQLIERCRSGNAESFETLVTRYQVMVCSIAYSIVGNVATSEDIGQEVFLTAWQKLDELRDAGHLKSWLATIARNQARAWLRRRTNTQHTIEAAADIPTRTEEDIVDREETDLVWQTLATLPEMYREPLILYYREEQSVSNVADLLALSESATKQRLARGREMLRSEVLATIERGLQKSVPTGAFAMGVMSLIATSSKTAAAATTGAVTAKAAAVMTKSAIGGAAAGSLIGLLGGFAGAFASWYNAEYQSQRQLIVRQSIQYLIGMSIFMIPFVAMSFGWRPTETFGVRGYQMIHAAWMLVFISLNCLWMFVGIRTHNKLQQHERSANTERLPRYQRLEQTRVIRHGRRWTSQRKWLGLPLVQIAFPDQRVGMDRAEMAKEGTARAWIALGYVASGRLLAMGHRATAPVAVGTRAVGILSIGVFSLGIVSFGAAASVGLFALGTTTLGVISFSGAIAAGYFAVAPLAVAIHAAQGAMAFSLQYAIGPSAFAPHANDAAAQHIIGTSPLMQQLHHALLDLAQSLRGTTLVAAIVGLLMIIAIAHRVTYTRSSH